MTIKRSFTPPSIIQAMEFPALFGPWYEGDSWNGWKAILKAAYALKMTAEEVEFFKSVAGGREPPAHRVKELWCVCGRGAGKDSIASEIVAYTAAMFNPKGLRRGERAIISCLACDRDQAKILLNYSRSFFTECPALKNLVARETAEGFELDTRVDIKIQTLSHRSVRGRSMLMCVLDECAFYRDDAGEYSNPDEEIYRAVLPGLARVPGSMLIGISSPYKKSGLLFRKWQTHFGQNDDDILVIQAPSRTLNPTLDEADIAKKLAEDPAAARAEWLAEWRDDIAGWLPYETIVSSVDTGVMVRPPILNRGITYHCGVDVSGGARDSYTASIAHRENDTGRVFLDAMIEIKPPFLPSEATEQVVALMKQYNIYQATGDRYAAQWVVEAFARHGIRYENSERDRSEIYLECLPLFTSGRISLLDSPRLVSQFAGLERRTSALGKDRVDHGRNGHDDLCNSAALAMVLAAGRPGDFDMNTFCKAWLPTSDYKKYREMGLLP